MSCCILRALDLLTYFESSWAGLGMQSECQLLCSSWNHLSPRDLCFVAAWTLCCLVHSLFFFLIFNLFIFGCARSSFLQYFFSSCREWELISICASASHCSTISCGSRALEQRLSHCGTWAHVGIFLDQGSNLCLLHWQAGSSIEPPGKSWCILLKCVISQKDSLHVPLTPTYNPHVFTCQPHPTCLSPSSEKWNFPVAYFCTSYCFHLKYFLIL